MDDMERRMRRLERATRMLIAVIAATAATGLVAATRPAADVIDARLIRIVDGDGKLRARFGLIDDRNPALTLADRKGNDRVLLTYTPEFGEQLQLIGSAPLRGVFLGVTPDEEAAVMVRAKAGVQLKANAAGESEIRIEDFRERPQVRFAVDAEGGVEKKP